MDTVTSIFPTPPPSPAMHPKLLSRAPVQSPEILPRVLQQLSLLHRPKGVNLFLNFVKQTSLDEAYQHGIIQRIEAQVIQEYCAKEIEETSSHIIEDKIKTESVKIVQVPLITENSVEKHCSPSKVLLPDLNESVGTEESIRGEGEASFIEDTSSEYSYSTQSQSDTSQLFQDSEDWDNEDSFESLVAEWRNEYGQKSWAEMCEELDSQEQFVAEVNVKTKSVKARKRKRGKKPKTEDKSPELKPVKPGSSKMGSPKNKSPKPKEAVKCKSMEKDKVEKEKDSKKEKSTDCSKAHSREVGGRTGERGKGQPKAQKQGKKLFVKNVNFKTSQHTLWNFFGTFGPVQYCQLIRDFRRRSKGIAYVTFENIETAERVLSAIPDELVLDDRELYVEPAVWGKKREPSHNGPADNQEKEDKPGTCPPVPSGSSHLTTPVHRLNDDVILKIFSYLNLKDRINLERVCRRWRYLSWDSWVSLPELRLKDLLKGFRAIHNRDFCVLVKKGRHNIKRIDISVCSKLLGDRSLEAIGHYCPNLEYLDMSGMSATNRGIRTLAQKCPKLKWVKITNCYDIGEDGLWWLFQRCKELRHVNLSGNKRIQGKCLHVLWDSLRYLNLASCSKLMDTGLSKIAMRCRHLEELDISDCLQLTGAGLQELTQACSSSLKILHLNGNLVKMSFEGLAHLGELSELEELYLANNRSISDTVLTSISIGCQKLRVLDLLGCHRWVTDVGLQSLYRCPHLAHLNVSYLHRMTDTSLCSIARTGSLRKLVAIGCGQISDTGIIGIISMCDKLEHVDVCGCIQITDAVLDKLLTVYQQGLNSSNRIKICTGGTSINHKSFTLPDDIQVSDIDLCAYNMRQDLDPAIYLGDEYEEEEGEDENLWVGAGGGGYEPDYQGHYISPEVAQDYLEADDPLAAEEWMLS